MSDQYILQAEPRVQTGTAAARRKRRAGRIPAIIYGAGKENVQLTLDQQTFLHQLETEAFHSAILSVVSEGKEEQAILRTIQMHPHKPMVLHVDLQRVSAREALNITIPLHLLNEEECVGVKTDGGILSTLMNSVEISCLPKDLPEYLEIDVIDLAMNQALHLSDIQLPEGVEIVSLASGGEDQSIVAVLPPKAAEEEEVEEEIEGEEGMEAAEAGEEAAEGSPEES